MSTKIKCNTLNATVPYQRYTTLQGNVYEFSQDIYTTITDPEDALFFLNAGKGALFSAESLTDKMKETLKKLASSKKKDVEEKKAPEEPKETDQEDENPDESLTKAGFKALTKDQQVYLIQKAKGKSAKIPRYEEERIELLLNLQKEGHDFVKLLK